jgi:dGTPase
VKTNSRGAATDDGPYARRRVPLTETERADLRTPFAIDCDRILYSRAYSRYIDKTQVFYLLKNDHITHRVLHVQLVSRIARTIGQKLGLNLDLIEAGALGHDLGHPPFGHDGERYLSELCEEAGIGKFVHAVMSVRFLEKLEKSGKGLNLTLGVLDAILCHDGESDFTGLAHFGGKSDFEELDERIALRLKDPSAMVAPMTREGCVVRLSDSISYVGRDLEDAILLGFVDRRDVPDEVVRLLGSTNGSIVYNLVKDLIEVSQKNQNITAFSPLIGDALTLLKNFNRERIYYNPDVKRDQRKLKRLFEIFFNLFAEEFSRPNGPEIPRLKNHLSNMSDEYREGTSAPEKARDFIAGMTDEYFHHAAEEILLPQYKRDF